MDIKFLNKDDILQGELEGISEHVVQLSNIEQNLSGFQVMYNGNLLGDYSQFKTLYRTVKNGYQLSDDGFVYMEPETIPPYVPTLDDIKEQKISEVSNTCQQIIFDGIDINLSIGEKHFGLTIEDQLNLFGKQSQLISGEEKFEYHADGESCIYYSKEDMLKIIESAMKFVSYHTTYCNSLFQWINSLENKEQIEKIKYGDDIPEEYQSEVLKDYIVLMGL